MARPSFTDLLQQPGRHAHGQGLFLVVRGPNSARWEYQARVASVLKSYWLGPAIGPGALSLTQARTERASKWLENRGKPGQSRNRVLAVAGKTFASALEAWLDANPSAWAEKSVKARRVLASTSLASLDVGKVTQSDVLAALANETPRQHAEKRGWLKAFFAYAKAKQWRSADSDNPAEFADDTRAGFDKVKKTGKHHAAIAWQDLPTVYKALPNSDVGNAVRFQALTAARPGEVEEASWSQIVPDNGHGKVWQYTILKGDIPFEQRVPLTPAALALIGEQGDKPGNALIFGKLPANAMLNTVKVAAADDKATAHGLRNTFNEWCDDQTAPAVDQGLIDAALAHYRGDKVQRAYSRGDLLNRRRTVMEAWAKHATGH